MGNKLTDTPGSNIVSTLVGASFILVGALLLIGRYIGARFEIDFGHYAWPLFIIAPGLVLFTASFAFDRRGGMALAIVGGMVAATGATLLFQNTFDRFSSWAYAWSLVVPTSIGLAQLVYGGLRRLENQVKLGLYLTGVGMAIFVFGGLFFELGIGISDVRFGTAWVCWPALLIGLGIVLLLFNLLPRRHPPSGNSEGETR